MDPWTCLRCGGKNRVGLTHCLRCGHAAPVVETIASQHAQHFVTQALAGPLFRGLPEILDFTPASLVRVDLAIDRLYGESGLAPGVPDWQPPRMLLQTVIDFGAYVGEVLCRNLPATWRMHAQFPDAVLQARVVDQRGRVINPFAQVAQRLRDGSSQPIAAIFTALTGRTLPVWHWPEAQVALIEPVAAAVAAIDPSPRPTTTKLSDVEIQQIFRTARAHLERGHLSNVVSVLQPLQQLDLNNEQMAERAELAIEAEAFASALSDLRALAARQPQSELWPEQIALALARLGQFDEALATLSAALRQFPTSHALSRRHAFLILKAGRYDQAELALLKLLQRQTDDPELLLGLAEAQQRQGRIQDAMSSLVAVGKSARSSERHRHAANQQLAALRAPNPAAEKPFVPAAGSATPAASSGPAEPKPESVTSAGAAYNKAIDLARAGRFPEALPWFKRAVELDPHNATHWKDLGNCMKDCGHPAPARACLERALVLDPNYTLVRYLIGQCHEVERSPDLAIACYKQILADLKSDQRWVDRAFARLQALGAA